jgi:hypothetical protein
LRLYTLQCIEHRSSTVISSGDDGNFQLDIDYCRLIIVD